MATEHNVISDGTTDSPYDGERHEPRGVSRAPINDVYLSNGVGSGSWQHVSPHGGMYFTDLSTPYTLAATTSYQLLGPITTATHLHDFTNGSGTLTYTGVEDRHLHLVFDAALDQSSGGARDVTFAWYRNGSIAVGAETVRTTASGDKGVIAIHWDGVVGTGDYFEIHAKISAAATINIYHYYMFAMGMPS